MICSWNFKLNIVPLVLPIHAQMWDHSHEHWQLPGVCPPHGRLVLLLSSCQIPLAPQIGVGPYTPSSIHARMLTGLVLLRQPQPRWVCVCNNCIMPHSSSSCSLAFKCFPKFPHQIILGSNASSKVDWLGLAQATPATVSLCEQQLHHAPETTFHSSSCSLAFTCFPKFPHQITSGSNTSSREYSWLSQTLFCLQLQTQGRLPVTLQFCKLLATN